MQLNFVIAGLPFLHEVVARYVAQYAAEGLLLLGLTVVAPSLSLTCYFAQTSRGGLPSPAREVTMGARQAHVVSSGVIT